MGPVVKTLAGDGAWLGTYSRGLVRAGPSARPLPAPLTLQLHHIGHNASPSATSGDVVPYVPKGGDVVPYVP